MSGPAPSPPVVVAPDYMEPDPGHCPTELSPEADEKLRNYRLLGESVRACAPISDVYTQSEKGKLGARLDVCPSVPPARTRILELVRPGDPGREALEAIVRPARRALALPLDEDTQRFLKRVLAPRPPPAQDPPTMEPGQNESVSTGTVSLAEELREAEDGRCENRELPLEYGCSGNGGGGLKDAMERERLGRLALSVEQDEWGAATAGSELCAAARRLDALLAESRALHGELAAIQRDLQAEAARAHRCAAAARALGAESRALRFLDDVVALLRGDVAAAGRARAWPFALGAKRPDRNYIV